MIKNIVLIIGLVSVCIGSAFSQKNNTFKIDTTLSRIYNYDKPKSYNLGLIEEFKIQNFKDSLVFKQSPRLNFGMNALGPLASAQFYSNMPCLKPEGNFPMHIVKPDSTLGYSMRVVR